MKKKDYIMILFVGLISAVISVVVSGVFITPADDRQQAVEVAAPLPSEFLRPSPDYFNEDSVNPTQTIEIGEDTNNQPFDTE